MSRFCLFLLVFIICCFRPLPVAAQVTGVKGSSESEVTTTASGTTYALVVGISQYEVARIRLNAADKDAALYARFLLETKKVQPEHLLLLLNRTANSNAVNQAVREFKKLPLKQGDEVIIYFSGHGDIQLSKDTSTKGYIGYLLCSDVNPDRAYTGAQGTVSFKDLNEVVEYLTQRGVMVSLILDACHSGQTVNEEGADLLSEGALSSFRNTIRYLSCGANQRSYENKELGHGYFTYYLVKGMMGAADNSPADNRIRVNELNLYVYNSVFDETQEKQEPTIGAPSGGKVVMLVSPEMKALTFERLRQTSTKEIEQSYVKAKSLVEVNEPWFTTLSPGQQELLTQINRVFTAGQTGAALQLYYNWKKDGALPGDWLRLIRLRLTQQLSIDPQQAVNTILQGRNNLPAASYFIAAAEKSRQLLQLLDTADYGYRIYNIYSRYLEAYSYLRGKQYRNYNKAKLLLTEALQLEPDAAFVLHALGLVAEYQNDYPLAESYFRKAIELIPTWTYPRSSLGNTLRDQNRYKEAISVFEEVIRLAPHFSWPYNNLANVYNDLNRNKEAERLYRYSVSIDTIDVAVEYNNLGLIYKDRGNIREAQLFYEKSIRSDSLFIYSYHNLADLQKKVNARLTLELLLRAVELEPFYSETLTKLADFYADSPSPELWQKADSLFLAAQANNPFDPWAYAGRAWLLARQKDTATALLLLRKGIQNNPGKPAAWAYQGRFFQQSKQYEDAMACYRKALSLSPWYWDAYEWMHETYLKQKKNDSAVWILQQAKQYFEESPDAYNLLGNYYFSRGDYNTAATEYAQALKADSGYAKAYSNLAYTSLELNRFDEAILYFKKAHLNDPLIYSAKAVAMVLIDKADQLLLQQGAAVALQLIAGVRDWIPAQEFSYWLKLVGLYYLEGKTAEGLTYASNTLQQTNLPSSFRYRLVQLLGWLYLDAGNPLKAKEMFEASLQLSVNPAYLGMAAVSLLENNKEAAQQWLEKEKRNNSNWADPTKWKRQYSNATQKILEQLKGI